MTSADYITIGYIDGITKTAGADNFIVEHKDELIKAIKDNDKATLIKLLQAYSRPRRRPNPIRAKSGIGKGKGLPGGLRLGRNTASCPAGGPGYGLGGGRGKGINNRLLKRSFLNF